MSELHNGWKTYRFDQIAEIISERVDPAEADTDIYVGLEHLEPEVLHIKRWGHPSDVEGQKLRFYPGDIIFGRRRFYQRKLAVAEFEGICSAHAMVIRANPEVVLPEFLPFFMQSDTFYERMMRISTGSLSPTINQAPLKRQEFALPPLDEQRRIAEILWAADEAISTAEQLQSEINRTTAAVRRELFSKSWATKSLGELFDVQLGKMLSPKAKQGVSPRPYLGNANVQWGHFNLEDLKWMDFDDEEFERYRLEPGDLLVCEGGEVGRSAIWSGQIAECCYQKALHRLRPLTDDINVELMLEFMLYTKETGQFDYLTGSSTIAHLTVEKLILLQVPIVAKAVQCRMLDTFRQLRSSYAEAEAGVRNGEALKRALLAELL